MIGGSIGFISGIVGIGGGIFLSPILLLIRAGKAKDINGVEDYAFAGCDALAFAENIHKTLGLGV